MVAHVVWDDVERFESDIFHHCIMYLKTVFYKATCLHLINEIEVFLHNINIADNLRYIIQTIGFADPILSLD